MVEVLLLEIRVLTESSSTRSGFVTGRSLALRLGAEGGTLAPAAATRHQLTQSILETRAGLRESRHQMELVLEQIENGERTAPLLAHDHRTSPDVRHAGGQLDRIVQIAHPVHEAEIHRLLPGEDAAVAVRPAFA